MTTTNHSKLICSNCLDEGVNPFVVYQDYFGCEKCIVTYAKNRKAETFFPDEEVLINNYHRKTDNRFFIIKGIFIHEECESGRMVFLVDKETGKPLKSKLDVNWLSKTKIEL